MNPETGKIERVMGTTADGLNVFESHGLRLKFTILCWEKVPAHCAGLYGAVEMQTNENGSKRPTAYLLVGRILFQSGWLFA
jgi:hypothetical protein